MQQQAIQCAPAIMQVPAPFTPLGKKAGEGGVLKTKHTALKHKKSEEIQMEVDTQNPSTSTGTPPESMTINVSPIFPGYLVIVDEEGMTKWTNDMLGGRPGGEVAVLNTCRNSFSLQFKTVVDTLT